MWIYNGEMLINLENGVTLHLETTNPMYGGYEATVVQSVPAEAEADNRNWIYQGTATECQNYLDKLSEYLNASLMPAKGTTTEPPPLREPVHVPADCSDQCSSDIPF